MSEQSNFLFWIKEKDKTQLNWAFKFMIKKGFRFPAYSSDMQYTMIVTNLSECSYEFIRGMRLAWNQQKQRVRDRQRDKSPYNFVMSLQAKSQLDYLARTSKKTITQALEDMLIEGGDYKKILAKEAQQELKQKKEMLEKEYKKKDQGKVSKAQLNLAERTKNDAILKNNALTKFANEQITKLYDMEKCSENLEVATRAQELYIQRKQQLEKIIEGSYFSKST